MPIGTFLLLLPLSVHVAGGPVRGGRADLPASPAMPVVYIPRRAYACAIG